MKLFNFDTVEKWTATNGIDRTIAYEQKLKNQLSETQAKKQMEEERAINTRQQKEQIRVDKIRLIQQQKLDRIKEAEDKRFLKEQQAFQRRFPNQTFNYNQPNQRSSIPEYTPDQISSQILSPKVISAAPPVFVKQEQGFQIVEKPKIQTHDLVENNPIEKTNIEVDKMEEPKKVVSKIDARCMKCRKQIRVKNLETVTTARGLKAIKGVCPDCGTKVFKMIGK